jgi:hypothetical protein
VSNVVYALWAVFVVVLLIIYFVFLEMKPKVDPFLLGIALVAVSVGPVAALLYKLSFEKSRWQDSKYSPFGS